MNEPMPPVGDVSCEKCRFWRVFKNGIHGTCQRYPPTVLPIVSDAVFDEQSRWPVTGSDESCGEAKSKPRQK